MSEKKDPNKVTLHKTESLPFWSAVLWYRYLTDLPTILGYTTTWIDYKRVDGYLVSCTLFMSVDQAAVAAEELTIRTIQHLEWLLRSVEVRRSSQYFGLTAIMRLRTSNMVELSKSLSRCRKLTETCEKRLTAWVTPSSTPDPRKILWYVDGTSNTGKTFVSRVLVTRGGCVRFENGRSADIKFAYRGNMAFNYANSELCVSVIPALPCQTSVRLHHGHLKQLIVQLTNGNILAQGRKCCSSVQKEFKCLLAVVYTLYTSVSHQQKSGIEPPSHQQQKTPKVSTPATLPCLL